tara:strand:+ start:401 stop:664 length:264 start_codon:yes stop_codon:yes gene_type:complete
LEEDDMDRQRMPFSQGFAMTTSDIFAPKKSVIVDMVMVQILTVIVTVTLILVLKNDSLGSDTIAWMMGSLMVGILLASAIYSRISSI